ncbi:MAG TPA: hypothetical protein VH458_15435 [Vicinamibacterales bacterium]
MEQRVRAIRAFALVSVGSFERFLLNGVLAVRTSRGGGTFSRDIKEGLSNIEIEHDDDDDIDRCARETAGLESPLRHGRDRLVIEPFRIQRSNDANVRRPTVPSHDEFQDDSPLNSTGYGILGVAGLHFLDDAGRRNGTTRPKRAPARSASGPGSDT